MEFYLSSLDKISEILEQKRIGRKALSGLLEKEANRMLGKVQIDNEYLKLLRLYYYKYDLEKNLKGKMYCMLKMQQVNSYKKNRKQRYRYPKIKFSALKENCILMFLKDKDNLYLDMVAQFIKEILVVDTVLTISLMAFLVVYLKVNFYLGFVISILLYLIIYYVSQYNLTEPRVDIRCSRLSKHIDVCLKQLDISLKR